MQPILLDRFQDLLSRLGAKALRHDGTILASSSKHTVHYVPFEHVNREARLVLVGITPGPAQIELAYDAVRARVAAGDAQAQILIEAKRAASFGGPTMRPNLLCMLEAFGFPAMLGIGAASDLWEGSAGLMHATSVVPHAAFEGDKPFAGSFDDIQASAPLNEMFEGHFVPSLGALRPDALYVALGPTPLAALDRCVARGVINSGQVLGAFAHPSTSGGSQVAVYLGEKRVEDLKERDPVRHRAAWLVDAAARMDEATRRLDAGRSGARVASEHKAVAPAPVPPTPAPARARAAVQAPIGAEALEVAAIEAAGFQLAGGTKKVFLFRRRTDGREVYFVRATIKRQLVVNPDEAGDAERALLGTGGRTEGPYHNQNMGRFPKRMHGGTGEVHYGLGYVFPSAGGMTRFLEGLTRS